MAHSEERKEKIGQGVRAAWERRKAAELDPIEEMKKELSNNFAEATPNRVQPSRVVSYGDVERTALKPRPT